jgi:hypothetical protein
MLANEIGELLTEEQAIQMMGEKRCWNLEDLRNALK